jgi:cytochrome c556
MNFMTKLTFAAMTLAMAFVIMAPAVPAFAADGDAVIEKRKKFMKKEILAPFKVIKAFVKNGKGTSADVASSASALSAAAGKITALYPKGTHRGAYDEKMTRALPKIWEDWKGFEAAAASLAAESAKLAQVAAGGDADAIAAQFGMTGKKGCGGCHKPFRGAKVK